jgi:ribosome-associated protein
VKLFLKEEVPIETKKLALRIAAIVKEKKGEDVVVLDMRPQASFCDYFVIVSANSLRQVNAIAQAIAEDLSKVRIKPLSKALSADESGWIAMDFSSVVAHIFYKPMREFYSLERLWSDAKRVRIEKKYSRPVNPRNKKVTRKLRAS